MRQKVLVLHPNNTYEIVKVKVENNKLCFKDKIQKFDVEIESQNVFEEIKPSWQVWRNPKRIMLHLAGNVKTIGVKPPKTKAGKPTIEMGFLSMSDILGAVKSVIVRGFANLKQMKQNQFYVLLGASVVNLMLTAFVLRSIGVF